MSRKLLICTDDLNFAETWRKFFHQKMGFDVLIETQVGRISHLLTADPIEFCFVERKLLEPLGLKTLDAFIKKFGSTYFLVMAESVNTHEEVTAVLFGMKGFIDKHTNEILLEKIITRVREGEIWVDRKFISRLLEELSQVIIANLEEFDDHIFDKKLEHLTTRELEIAKLVCIGSSNPRIAQILMITERTVKAHLSSIFQKLNVNDRLQLALFMSQAFRVLAKLSQSGTTP